MPLSMLRLLSLHMYSGLSLHLRSSSHPDYILLLLLLSANLTAAILSLHPLLSLSLLLLQNFRVFPAQMLSCIGALPELSDLYLPYMFLLSNLCLYTLFLRLFSTAVPLLYLLPNGSSRLQLPVPLFAYLSLP